jgi:hypothetical protein
MRPADLEFLRGASGILWPEPSETMTFEEYNRTIDDFERDAPPDWQQRAREGSRWIDHVNRVLEDVRAIGYCPSQPPASTAAAIARASTALGALSIILRDSLEQIEDEDRALLERIAADIAEAAARVFSRASEAWDLVTADASVESLCAAEILRPQ